MLTRHDPFREALSLRRAMDQLFERSFVNPHFMSVMPDSPPLIAPIDVCETPSGYEVDVALPGVRPEDIELTVDQNTLTIQGQYDHQNHRHEQLQSASPQQQSSSPPNQQTAQQSSPSSGQPEGGQMMQSPQQGHTCLSREIVSGSFQRTITFPKMIDPDKIQTTFQNGILTIMASVSEASRPKRISVSKQGQLQGSTAGN
jgi:HSP20 family protein